MGYPFTREQFAAAHESWGCNCGPSALAFALQIPLDRAAIPGFEEKRYTSPTMMRAALAKLKVAFAEVSCANREIPPMFDARPSLVRLQWDGPWCAPGANPKWAYWQTHWIATWAQGNGESIGGIPLAWSFVFDCNGGAMMYAKWVEEIVPQLTASYKRSNGKWFPTHIWRITKGTP